MTAHAASLFVDQRPMIQKSSKLTTLSVFMVGTAANPNLKSLISEPAELSAMKRRRAIRLPRAMPCLLVSNAGARIAGTHPPPRPERQAPDIGLDIGPGAR